jgi:hypothetical protein
MAGQYPKEPHAPHCHGSFMKIGTNPALRQLAYKGKASTCLGRGGRLRERKERLLILADREGARANPNENLFKTLFSLNTLSMQSSMSLVQ